MNQPSTVRAGLFLFVIYAVAYVGFVVLNAVIPSAMSWQPVAGLNLAVIYGIGLIVLAFVLALVYGVLAAHRERGWDQSNRSAPP